MMEVMARPSPALCTISVNLARHGDRYFISTRIMISRGTVNETK